MLGLPRLATAAMVVAAGLLGLGGLVAGRWAADRLGRRVTAGTSQAVIALAAMLTYSGSAAVVALPVLALSPLYGRLPETVGLELEESAPD